MELSRRCNLHNRQLIVFLGIALDIAFYFIGTQSGALYALNLGCVPVQSIKSRSSVLVIYSR
jgi:hypothetical protein